MGRDVDVAGGWVEWASNQRMSVCRNVASRDGVVSLEKDFCEWECVWGPAKEGCVSTDIAARRGGVRVCMSGASVCKGHVKEEPAVQGYP